MLTDIRGDRRLTLGELIDLVDDGRTAHSGKIRGVLELLAKLCDLRLPLGLFLCLDAGCDHL